MSEGYAELLGVVIVLLLVFAIFREFFTWYWKINRIVALLEKIEAILPVTANSLN